MSRKISIILVLAILAAFIGYAAWRVLLAPSDLPPDGFAQGNGRIEADLVDVSTRLAGRVAEITVRESDMVQRDDVLAVMDTAELMAQKMRAEATVASATVAVTVAQAGIAQAEASLALSQTLNARGVVTGEELDITRTQVQLDAAGLAAAQATTLAKERAVDAKTAALHGIGARIDDSTLHASQAGRGSGRRRQGANLGQPRRYLYGVFLARDGSAKDCLGR